MFRLGKRGVSTMAVGSALAVLSLVGAPAAQAAAGINYATTTAVDAEASMDWSG